MLKRISTIISTGAAAAAVAVTLGAAPSSATTATTWTIKPGGSTTASGPLALKDTKTGVVTACKTVKLDATLKSGSGLVGAAIGSITSATFTDCELFGSTGQSSPVVNGLPWKLSATSYSAKTGVTKGTITGIDLVATATACDATLDGTAAGKDNGKVKFTYANSTGKLKLLHEDANLHWWAVSGCLGLINTGDPVQPTRSLTVKPKQLTVKPRQTITSP
jgi:hypothetical protein